MIHADRGTRFATRGWLYAALVATILITSQPAGATPFTFVVAEIFGANEDASSAGPSGGPVLTQVGDPSSAFGKASAQFYTNGFAVQRGGSTGAAALSIWTDGFTVTDPSGPGMLSVTVQLRGSVLVGSQEQVDMSYALLRSDSPFDLTTMLEGIAEDDQDINVDGADQVSGAHTFKRFVQSGLFGDTLPGTVPFTSGQTFYLASIFLGDVSEDHGGSGNFLDSVSFRVVTPPGATITTISGANPSPVPEPATMALVVAAGFGVYLSRRRARARVAA